MAVSAVARQWALNIPIISLCVNRHGDILAAAMADGSLRLLTAGPDAQESTPHHMKLHDGVSLSLEPDADGHGFLSGGDDGKLCLVDPRGVPMTLAEHQNQWIDHVASSAEGFRAYSIGKNLYLIDAEGKAMGAPKPHPSSIGDLKFSPNGKRLAASHYGGVTLWWVGAKETTPTHLNWKGSHLDLCWSPDSKILMTSMQDSALHGWRFSDMKEMSMEGYAGKIHSMQFTAKGKYLASSGASQAICWPFFSGGPWGKPPVTLGSGETRLVTRVAAHPKDELVASGYDDGMIILGPLDGRTEMLIHAPVALKGAAVTGMVWSGAGDCLFASLEDGTLLLFTIDSVTRSVKGD